MNAYHSTRIADSGHSRVENAPDADGAASHRLSDEQLEIEDWEALDERHYYIRDKERSCVRQVINL